jgi:hypothetical protein
MMEYVATMCNIEVDIRDRKPMFVHPGSIATLFLACTMFTIPPDKLHLQT